MPLSSAFATLVQQLTEGMALRDVALRAELNHTTIAAMRRDGHIPRPETLAQFCDRLAVDAETRSALFGLAGYRDPAKRDENLPPGYVWSEELGRPVHAGPLIYTPPGGVLPDIVLRLERIEAHLAALQTAIKPQAQDAPEPHVFDPFAGAGSLPPEDLERVRQFVNELRQARGLE